MSQCAAQAKHAGRQCRRRAMVDQRVCDIHGGKSKQALARVQRDRVEIKARRTLADMGHADPIDNPLTELARLAGEVVAWKELIAGYVADLNSVRYSTDAGEQVRGEIVLFERALDRCAVVLTAIARLNIDDRLARVSERQAATVADALGAVLADMGLSHEQQREARTRVARHLRSVAG